MIRYLIELKRGMWLTTYADEANDRDAAVIYNHEETAERGWKEAKSNGFPKARVVKVRVTVEEVTE